MRAIWTGALSFGLVNIPVRLYSATAGTELKFHYLHKADNSPIRYAKICRADGTEVPFEDIVKGYEYTKGDYVILTEDDFERANAKKTKTIDIVEFVKASDVDPLYYEKPYFLEPDKGAEKPYALLREALRHSNKIGVARFVLRQREHLAALRPQGDAIVLDQLRFADEVREPTELNLPKGLEAEKREIELALSLIDHLSGTFHPENFKDTYKGELEKVIEAKAKGQKLPAIGKAPEPTEVKDLMATLKASLEKAHKA